MIYRILAVNLLSIGIANAASMVAQPTTCISSKFTASGDQYWKTITLKLTNNCKTAVNFENTTVTFKNKSSLNTQAWGSFSPLPYPDAINISSQPQSDGSHLATVNMHFTAYPGSTTSLPIGKSIQIQYGVNSDTRTGNTADVYVGETPVETKSLQIKNISSKPSNVSQNYALVHLTANGSKVNDVQVPWNSTVNVPNLAQGSYAISPEDVSDNGGTIYRGTAVPSTVTLGNTQQASSTISYTQVQQEGKISIMVQNVPQELSGYTQAPQVLLRETQAGSTTTQNINWNTTSTITQLKSGSSYALSTEAISYNGVNCTPSFSKATVTAATTAASTTLTYKCVQVAQNMVTINVSGAPASLNAFNVTLTPNNNSGAVNSAVPLSDGKGTNTVMLTDGVIYTLSANNVSGYNIKFSPQPLTSTANTAVTVTLTSQSSGTPVAANGQLTVCGTKLCNEQGTPIQLKGMSTHGLQWLGEGICITTGSLDTLANNFKANVIRLALYIQEGGYESNPNAFSQQVKNLINAATSRGLYVIVDWHILNPGDPNYNLTIAKQFFTTIATAYKNQNNIIYEIANEPNGVSWSTIKSYADQIIPVIRAIDPKAPIIIGTRGWSSLGVSEGGTYQEIVNNPVKFANIMYAFHFYAASHQDNYLSALDNASNVLPIFVTEFGTQTYSGDGNNDFTMSDKYMQLMTNKKIGWTNWNYSDDFRSGAIWNTGTCSINKWTDDRLKPAGVYIKNKIINP